MIFDDMEKLAVVCDPKPDDSAEAVALRLAITYLALKPYPGDEAMEWTVRYFNDVLPEIVKMLNEANHEHPRQLQV